MDPSDIFEIEHHAFLIVQGLLQGLETEFGEHPDFETLRIEFLEGLTEHCQREEAIVNDLIDQEEYF